jgi:hypothetical protein
MKMKNKLFILLSVLLISCSNQNNANSETEVVKHIESFEEQSLKDSIICESIIEKEIRRYLYDSLINIQFSNESSSPIDVNKYKNLTQASQKEIEILIKLNPSLENWKKHDNYFCYSYQRIKNFEMKVFLIIRNFEDTSWYYYDLNNKVNNDYNSNLVAYFTNAAECISYRNARFDKIKLETELKSVMRCFDEESGLYIITDSITNKIRW